TLVIVFTSTFAQRNSRSARAEVVAVARLRNKHF
ncbi:unnamed protein product, partial [Amoebophrya sp. A120]